MSGFTESVAKEGALAWLEGLGWKVLHGPEIVRGELAAECFARFAHRSARGFHRHFACVRPMFGIALWNTV